MPKERFYFEGPLLENEGVKITEEEFHHLVHVMRIKPGDEIEIVNGEGFLAKGFVESLGKREALIKVKDIHFAKESDFNIILAQGNPRKNKLDDILEKATELGAAEIWLFPGERSEIKELNERQLARAKTILVSAMKQSGRLYLPKLQIKPPLKKFLSLQFPAFFGDIRQEAPNFLKILEDKEKKDAEKKGIIFFVGPESGFTESEELLLEKLGAKGVKLNANILRTETAAITAIALISAIRNI